MTRFPGRKTQGSLASPRFIRGCNSDLVGAVGIEPTTFGLKGRCSTTELRPWGVRKSDTVRVMRELADGVTLFRASIDSSVGLTAEQPWRHIQIGSEIAVQLNSRVARAQVLGGLSFRPTELRGMSAAAQDNRGAIQGCA
jgi:hypothetical protein